VFPRVTGEALRTLCRDAIAPYKNPTGKILKKELRQRAALE